MADCENQDRISDKNTDNRLYEERLDIERWAERYRRKDGKLPKGIYYYSEGGFIKDGRRYHGVTGG